MELDVSNLEKGLVLKNYKTVCEAIGQPVKTGKGKMLQVKEWSRYFKYSKLGHSFVIERVYRKPRDKLDKRVIKGGKYTCYIESLLIEYLINQKHKKLTLPKNKVYELLGMVKVGYFEKKHDYDRIIDYVKTSIGKEISEKEIQSFTKRIGISITSILSSALKSMIKRKIIDVNMEYVVCSDEEEYNFMKRTWDIRQTYKVAKTDETERIYEIEKEILDKLQCDTFTQVILHGLTKKYAHELDLKIKSEFNWNYIYKQINITYLDNKDNLINSIKTKDLSVSERKKALNEAIIITLNCQAQKNNDNLLEKIHEGSVDKCNYKDSYVDIQKCLTEYLIKIT